MSMLNINSYSVALKNFLKAMQVLREKNMLINKKDFTCQIGEWLVEMIYEGQRSPNGIQKGWDVIANGKYFQVKAHAKAETNNARWTAVDKLYEGQIDYLIIIVFSQDYKLKEFYNIPWSDALPKIKLRGKKKPRWEITWHSIRGHKVELETLPRQEIIQLFK